MRRSSAVVLALLLSGCGGGGSASSHAAVPGVPQAGPKGNGNIQFSITVPAQRSTAQIRGRTPKYVSPNTKSVAVTVAGMTTNIDVVSGSPGCNTDFSHPSFLESAVNQQPRGMLRGADGNIWFVEDAGGAVGTIAPGNAYTDLSTGRLQNTLIVGPDGFFWIADVFSSTIGHLAADGSSYSQFSGMPSDLQFLAMASDQTVWFTPFTSGPPNTVYHVSSNGSYLPNDTITTTAATGEIILGSDNAMWVAENDGNHGWLARIARSGVTWSLTNEYPLPGIVAAITLGPDGTIYGVDGVNGHVYRVTATGVATTIATVTPGLAFGITPGLDGALWVAEYANNLIGRVTFSGAVNEFTVPTAGAAPAYLAYGSDNSVYFSEESANKVGRLSFPVACTATAAAPAGTASVTVTAYDATGGASGSGKKLSTQTVPVSIIANTTNTVNFVLNGIVKSVVVSTGFLFTTCAASGTIPITVQALDASNNAIVGPGSYSDASGNPLSFTLTTTDTSGETTFSNGVITAPSATAPALNWSGGFLQNQSVGVTVTGGTIAGTVTPVSLSGCT